MKVDTQSDTWFAISAFLAEEKASASAQVANWRNDLPTTNVYRGVLMTIARLEALAAEKQVSPEFDSPIPYEVGGT